MKKIAISFSIIGVIAICLAYGRAEVSTDTIKTITLPPEKVDLKQGKGLEEVLINCQVCHSADYIPMQPRLSKAQWAAEVNKMVRVYGAKISEGNAKIISDYLSENYGKGQ
jgi:mono/diheme cytochrome c family protein